MTTIAATRTPTFTPIPKRTGGTRIITHLATREAARYARLVARVTRQVDGALARGVATDRLACGGRALESSRGARRRFRAALTDLRGADIVLARVDVRDCFPSITPVTVERCLVDLGCHPTEVLPVRRFLEELGDLGVRGVPVGPQVSGILANAVLQQVDRSLEREHVPFARWVDDVFVAAADERSATDIVERIAETLSAIGLRLNRDKTGIGPGHAADRLAGILVSPSGEAGSRGSAS
ncbi:MAG: RNA-directed DNA polymerase [Actinomycetota bacterium]